MRDVSSQRGTNPHTRDANAAQRVSLAVKLRTSKMTYEAIARQCGYSNASACRKAIQRELERVVVNDVETLRREEVTTLDTMQSECMRLFMDRENKGRLFAADRLLAIMERRAKLLGLDATSKELLANQNYTKTIRLTHVVEEVTHATNS